MKRVVIALVVAASGGSALADDLDLLRSAATFSYDLVGGPTLQALAPIAKAPVVTCELAVVSKAISTLTCATTARTATPLGTLLLGKRTLLFTADGVRELRGDATAAAIADPSDAGALTLPVSLDQVRTLAVKSPDGGTATVTGAPTVLATDAGDITGWLSEATTVAAPVTGVPKPAAVETAAVFAKDAGPMLLCVKRATAQPVYVCLRMVGVNGGPTARTPVVPAPTAKPTPKPAPTVSISRKKARMTSTLTAAAVAQKIQSAYLGGVKRCYAQTTAKKPKAAGTLSLVFTVNAVGKAEGVIVKSFDDDLTACTKSAMAAWRFAIPQGEYGSPQAVTFEVDLKLAMK